MDNDTSNKDSSTEEILKKRIIDELKKTGFPTEILIGAMLQENKWNVLHNPSYLDSDENTNREFDLKASKEFEISSGEKTFKLIIHLIIECKKSESPWVFFITNESLNTKDLGKVIFANSRTTTPFFWIKGVEFPLIHPTRLKEFHHYFTTNKRARTYYEPFKGNEKSGYSSQIFTAVTSITKAVLFLRQQLMRKRTPSLLNIYYPIILFNGNLFEAEVFSASDIHLNPANQIQLSYNYIDAERFDTSDGRTGNYEFVVDVVRDTYLPDFLRILENEQLELRELIGDLLRDGKLI